MHELEATNDKFWCCKQRRNCALIYEHQAMILLQVWDILSRKKSCSDLWASSYDLADAPAMIWLQWSHRASIYSIGVRFQRIWNFSYKSEVVFRSSVRNFGEEYWLLELDIGDQGGRSSKLIVGYPIHVMNPSFTLVIYALTMSS